MQCYKCAYVSKIVALYVNWISREYLSILKTIIQVFLDRKGNLHGHGNPHKMAHIKINVQNMWCTDGW